MSDIWFIIGAPLARSIFGWLQNSLADGIIDFPELKKLGSTLFRVGGLCLAGYFGLEAFGMEYAGMLAAAGSFSIDWLYTEWHKRKNKYQKKESK